MLRAAPGAALAPGKSCGKGVLGDPLDLKAAVGFRRELGNGPATNPEKKGERFIVFTRLKCRQSLSACGKSSRVCYRVSRALILSTAPTALTDCDDLTGDNPASLRLFRSAQNHMQTSAWEPALMQSPLTHTPVAGSHHVKGLWSCPLLSVTGARWTAPPGVEITASRAHLGDSPPRHVTGRWP